MSGRQPGESISEFAARIKAERQAADDAAKWERDLIPDVPAPARSREQTEMDTVLDGIDVVQAYNRWCGKMDVVPGRKRESIMVRCPFPGHNDEHPSAWLTLDKGDGGVGNCAKCGGFDKYDLAAIRFGFNIPEYKDKALFPALRRMMAEDLGYTVVTSSTGKEEWLEREVPADDDEALAASIPAVPATVDVGGGVIREEPAAAVDSVGITEPTDGSSTPDIETSDDAYDDIPSFNWRELPSLDDGTFMKEWMDQAAQLYQPEEFYFFLGLQALGCAVGNHVVLDDELDVRANLMCCLVGSTGTGKTRSMNHLKTLLRTALPWKADDGSGVRSMQGVASGEALIDSFCYETKTDDDPPEVIKRPINGFIEEDELESLMAKVNRHNSVYRPVLMNLFDSTMPVTSLSRAAGGRVAAEHFMQLVTSIQPKRLSTVLSSGDTSSGFLNRFVFVWGPPKHRPAFSTVRPDFAKAADLLATVRAWSSLGRRVRFLDQYGLPIDRDACDRWTRVVQDRIRPLEDSDAPVAGRIELQCKKLLLLLAINQKSTIITSQHVQALEKLMDYLFSAYERVDVQVGLTDTQECITAILKYMADRPGQEITYRMLSFQSGARKFDDAVRARALDLMIGKWIRVIEKKVESNKITPYRVPRYELLEEVDTGLATVTSITPDQQ